MASSREWFESVAEAHRRARRRLPGSVYKALLAGTEKGLTLRDNVAAFDELGLVPRLVGFPGGGFELSTRVMGQEVSLPVLISPTGVQAVHPEGELAVARAAAARGTAMGLSSFASKPVEEVLTANPKTFFQTYWVGGRERMLRIVERAQEAGAAGMILTLDWSFSHSRDWGSPAIPDRIDLKTMLRFAPEVALKPGWLLRYARSRSLPELTVPNMAPGPGPKEAAPTFFGAYAEWMGSPSPGWDDVAWLRERWGGPFMLKGVMRVDEALRAVEEVGVTAISVSNHGGNNLDGVPASVRALPAIAGAVGDRAEVLLDGGIRRGSDVVKAVALGARAVMIGRAYLWGLAAGGQAGVENVLDVLRGGIESTLRGLGKDSIHRVGREDLIVPEGFERRLGVEDGG